MQKYVLSATLLILTLSLLSIHDVSAAPSLEVTNDRVTFNFPESATFSADISSGTEIKSVVLEYGNNQLTCGDVIAKAFPEITPSTSASVSWTWDMRQSGSLPPGATLWWHWRIIDVNGNESVSETKTAIWLDSQHDWQIIKDGDINFHWYSGDDSFAKDLINSAQGGLALLKKDAGLTPNAPIDIYIYANTSDMKDAILYEPSWTGGQAFPEENIVILGISQSDLDWGRKSIVHELTHVLVGHLTFSCLGDVPTWLDEGLAVYSEGELDPASQSQLDQAIQANQLLSVRSLSAGFSEVSDKANLSYSQSYSVVKFLIGSYGQDKMNALLIALRDGATVDEALTKIYGFDVDGLEDAWRAAIGAGPRPASAQPTAQVTPTFVPTYVPVSGAALAVTPTPYAIPTSSFDKPSQTSSGPPLTLTLAVLGFCCVLLLIVGVFALGIILRNQKKKGSKNE
jgi:peptidase MA superfamily protein